MIDIDIEDIPVLIIGYILITLGSGYVYSEIWRIRGTKHKFIATFNAMLRETDVGKALIEINGKILSVDKTVNGIKSTVENEISEVKTTVENIQIPDGKDIGDNLFNRLKGAMGGLKKGMNAEEKELMADLSEVAAVEYPGLTWVNENLNILTELGIIDQSWGDKYRKLANYPQALPTLEKAALVVKSKFEKTGGDNSKKGGFFWKK